MTERGREVLVDERQREAEQSALRKVRGLLDDIASEEQKDHRLLRRMVLFIGALVLLLTVGGLMVKPAQFKELPGIASALPPKSYTDAVTYASEVRNALRPHLVIPPDIPDTATVIVEISLSQAGMVAEFKFVKSSGISAYDEAVRQAILRAQPLPLLFTAADPVKPESLRLVWRAKD